MGGLARRNPRSGLHGERVFDMLWFFPFGDRQVPFPLEHRVPEEVEHVERAHRCLASVHHRRALGRDRAARRAAQRGAGGAARRDHRRRPRGGLGGRRGHLHRGAADVPPPRRPPHGQGVGARRRRAAAPAGHPGGVRVGHALVGPGRPGHGVRHARHRRRRWPTTSPATRSGRSRGSPRTTGSEPSATPSAPRRRRRSAGARTKTTTAARTPGSCPRRRRPGSTPPSSGRPTGWARMPTPASGPRSPSAARTRSSPSPTSRSPTTSTRRVRRSSSTPTPTSSTATVDGNGHIGELSVPRDSILRLLCDGRVEFNLDTPDGRTVGIARISQAVPRWLGRKIARRDGCCRFPGCDRPIRHRHHIRWWSKGGPTNARQPHRPVLVAPPPRPRGRLDRGRRPRGRGHVHRPVRSPRALQTQPAPERRPPPSQRHRATRPRPRSARRLSAAGAARRPSTLRGWPRSTWWRVTAAGSPSWGWRSCPCSGWRAPTWPRTATTPAERRRAVRPPRRRPSDDDGTTTSTEPTTTTTTAPPIVAATTVMESRQRITGDISPKSVVASGGGLVFAQNMMYTHSVTAYRADGTLAATIDDGVDLATFGVDRPPRRLAGRARWRPPSPATAATPTSRTTRCTAPGSARRAPTRARRRRATTTRSSTGSTPRRWRSTRPSRSARCPSTSPSPPTTPRCSSPTGARSTSASIDVAAKREVARIPIGRYPRGIVVSPDSRTAYVAVMGGDVIVRVDLADPAGHDPARRRRRTAAPPPVARRQDACS